MHSQASGSLGAILFVVSGAANGIVLASVVIAFVAVAILVATTRVSVHPKTIEVLYQARQGADLKMLSCGYLQTVHLDSMIGIRLTRGRKLSNVEQESLDLRCVSMQTEFLP